MVKIKNYKLVNGVSEKTGHKWTAIEIEFENGYKKLLFIDSKEKFILGINEN